MADITKVGNVSLASIEPPQNCSMVGLVAGEAITQGDLCYIKSDGKVWRSDGSAADALAAVIGMAMTTAAVGRPVTLVWDVTVRYGAGLTPGTKLYLSVNTGLIADAASTGGTAPIGYVVDATRIHIWQSRY